MQSKNLAALAALGGVLFFERFAYYAFRASMFTRFHTESQLAVADIGRIAAMTTIALLVAFALGAGISAFARHRLVMAGLVVALAAGHALGAASVTAGAFVIPLFSGIVRPLLMLAIAEELAREGRIWSGMAAGAGMSLLMNVGAFAGGSCGGLTSRSSGFLAVPPVLMMLAIVCAAVLAFAFPGAPFEWPRASDATVVPGPGLYRAEPVVVRSGGAPSVVVLAIVAAAAVVVRWEQTFHSEALYRTVKVSALNAMGPLLSCAFGAIFGAIAAALASSKSRVSPTLALGGATVCIAISAFVMVVASVTHSKALAILSMLLDAASDPIFTAVCLGFAFTTTSSRHVGLVAGALSALFLIPSLFFRTLTPLLDDGGTILFVVAGVLTLATGVVTMVVGPRIDRAPEPPPAPGTLPSARVG